MKKLSYILIMCTLFVCASAKGQEGATCDNPYRVGNDWQKHIDAGTVWLTDVSSDLPFYGTCTLDTFYIPTEVTDSAEIAALFPVVTIDLGCDGNYSSLAQTLIFVAKYAGYDIPLVETWKPTLKRTGKYILESGLTNEQLHALTQDSIVLYRGFGDTFVNAFAMLGITEDVAAFVRIDFPMGGTLSFVSTSVSTRCADGSVKVEKNSPVSVAAEDTTPYYYLPDDLRGDHEGLKFYWTGSAPANVYMYEDCEKKKVDYDYINNNFTVSPRVNSETDLWLTLSPSEVTLAMDGDEMDQYCRYSSTYIFFFVESEKPGTLTIGHQSDSYVGLEEVKKNASWEVTGGKKEIKIATSWLQNISIFTLTGINVYRCQLNENEDVRVTLPAGIYVVRGENEAIKVAVY